MTEEERKILEAWTNPGPRPDIHAWHANKLREEWPTLARALDALASLHGYKSP